MKLNFLELKNCFIFKQLEIEEALLRGNDQNWCIINSGSKDAIVMGSSGRAEKLLDLEKVKKNNTPVIKRFSGGGTVYIDENTLFVSFIFKHEGFNFLPFPEPILRWTESFYKKALNLDGFSLKENDYTIGNNKCGGNAQYIRKNRWLHHSSFLWNYKTENMRSLLFPPKVPTYRKKRDHNDFLCKLAAYFEKKEHFLEKVKYQLLKDFEVCFFDQKQVKNIKLRNYKKTLAQI